MASKLACDYIPHTYFKTKSGSPADALTKAYQDVGAQIYNKAAANPDFHRMGTTCSTLILLPAGALIAHVGDSRVYRIREGRIDQLSFDHSLVWELVRKGHMKPEQAQKAYPRNVITRSLGPEPTVEVDVEGPLGVEAGDVFVICSDGLSGPVHDPEIGAIAASFHPEEAARFLTQLANLRGGADNISVVVVRVGPWVEPGEEAAIDGTPRRTRKGKGSFLSGLLGTLKNRNHEGVEENRYQSAECPLDQTLVATLNDVVKNSQAMAVEQAWSLDWPSLTSTRREAEECFRAGQLRQAVRLLCESIVSLGLAGRLHRKETLNQGWA
jgi:protein phosphatase